MIYGWDIREIRATFGIYSSLTLVLAFCEGSHNSPKNKFSSYLTLYIVPHIPKASGICEKNFKDFLWKIYERKMKNLWKTCHPFCWVHRVYGMQNDRLNLTVILAGKNFEKMPCIQRFLHFFDHFPSLVLQISLDTKHFFCNFFQQEWPWDRAGRFAYHKPYELYKMCDDFFMDFSFFAHRFFWKNLRNFFLSNGECPVGIWNYIQGQNRRKIFLVEIWLPSQDAGTRVSLLYRLEIWHIHLPHTAKPSPIIPGMVTNHPKVGHPPSKW